ncbi:SH3 domain-containing protein [Yinghuangia soli]|uniref:SH3 domain-containing protein n=1 Tax=Yinghuangia soli TaxID=2908204 RepID=A0AA41U395_9ACTN|nr:SH3 domain-containing protein [Yinghuangia soli]MCF2531600.1 SH3 domain-containing protein [Yinghuangia soli]
MPQKWQTTEHFRTDEPVVAVYRPRRGASGGAWVCLAALVLALVVGGNGSSGDGGSPGPGAATAEQPTGPVTATVRTAGALPARAQADSKAAHTGSLPSGAKVRVACHTAGDAVRGPSGRSTVWVQVSYDGVVGFAPSAWLETRGDVTALVPTC